MRRALVRVVTAYDDDGELIGERVLAMPLADLRRLFGGDAHDEMRGVYRVGEAQAEAVGDALGDPLDLSACAYYVESYELGADD